MCNNIQNNDSLYHTFNIVWAVMFFLSKLPVAICGMVEFHLGGNLFLIQNLYSIRISTQMTMLFNVSLRYIK